MYDGNKPVLINPPPGIQGRLVCAQVNGRLARCALHYSTHTILAKFFGTYGKFRSMTTVPDHEMQGTGRFLETTSSRRGAWRGGARGEDILNHFLSEARCHFQCVPPKQQISSERCGCRWGNTCSHMPINVFKHTIQAHNNYKHMRSCSTSVKLLVDHDNTPPLPPPPSLDHS